MKNADIDWSKHLFKYGTPTVFKETLLKPFFEKENLAEPILDAGCGTGYFSALLCKRGFHVTGIDLHSNVQTIEQFTFIESDIVSFETKQKYKTILLINILSTASTEKRTEIINKIANLKEDGGKIYVINTNSELFGNDFFHEKLYIKKIRDGYVNVKTKLVDGQYIDFNDFIVTSDEMRRLCDKAKLKIVSEKEFRYPEIEKPIYNLYILE